MLTKASFGEELAKTDRDLQWLHTKNDNIIRRGALCDGERAWQTFFCF